MEASLVAMPLTKVEAASLNVLPSPAFSVVTRLFPSATETPGPPMSRARLAPAPGHASGSAPAPPPRRPRLPNDLTVPGLAKWHRRPPIRPSRGRSLRLYPRLTRPFYTFCPNFIFKVKTVDGTCLIAIYTILYFGFCRTTIYNICWIGEEL